ncbi:MAG: hypothetical protein JXO22_08440 [Phycisphaerae bacterium]|nr:hypothetical protein [Phycisphaerae bacterium]
MWDFDLFTFYRMCLFVFLTIYAVLATAGTVVRLARLLRGRDPHRRMLRLYLSYQVVTFNPRPLAGELLQIGAWSIILVVLWQLHSYV